MINKASRFFTPAIFVFLFSNHAGAFSMEVNDFEFNSWDTRCQAFYLRTQVGRYSVHRSKLPASTVQFWDSKTWLRAAGPWHYCGGLIWYQRAKFNMGKPELFEKYMGKAISAAMFTHVRMETIQPWWAEITTNLARMHMELGEFSKAEKLLDNSMRLHPDFWQAYLAKAILFWEQDKVNDAIALLESAEDQHGFDSPEIHYNLGIFHLAVGNIEEAKRYAKLAYSKRYPARGLRDLLARQGIELSGS